MMKIELQNQNDKKYVPNKRQFIVRTKEPENSAGYVHSRFIWQLFEEAFQSGLILNEHLIMKDQRQYT